MRMWMSEPSLWVIVFLLYAGVSGQYNVTVVTNQDPPYTIGKNLILMCMVDPSTPTNANISYLWQCSGCFADGNTTQTVNRSLTVMDSSMINCTVFVDDVDFMSDTFDLQVTVPLNITISPSGPIQGAMVGSPQVINCTVSTISGVESSSVMISWMGPEGVITNDSRVTISPTTSSGNNYTSSLQFTYLMEGDEGTYTCNVMILDTSGSQSVELQSLTIPTPAVTVSPTTGHILGQSLTLQCNVTTVRGITSRVDIVWSSGGIELQRMNNVSSTTMDNSLVYTDSYPILQLSTTDEGRVIQCQVVINASPLIMANDSITLDVTVPTNVTISPPGPIQGAIVGDPLVINCMVSTVDGVESSSVMISWMGPGGVITNDSRVTISPTTSSGNTYTSSLQFTYLMEEDEGTYTCNVMILDTNGLMLGTNVSQLVLESLTIPTPNVDIADPSTQTVGQSLTLQCEVTTVRGITSRVDIVWSSGGTPLRTMNGVVLTMMGDSLVYTDSYTISQLSTTDEGRVIQCGVVINASPLANNSITLDVTVPTVMPEVNQTVQNPDEGSSHNLTCTFRLPIGVSPELLQIEWSGHRSLMPSNSRVIISNLTSATVAQHVQYMKTVTFPQVQPVDDGNYTCTVTITGFTTTCDVITVNVVVVSGDSDSSATGAVVGGVLGALFAIIIVTIILLILVIWYRRKKPDAKNVETAIRSRKRTSSDHSLSSKHGLIGGKNGSVVPSSPSDIPMTPLEDGVKQRMMPIALEKFSSYVQEMHKDRDLGFEAEYGTISDQSMFTLDAAKTSANNPKNRYVNINPYDYSRVKLLGVSGKGKDTDYINASYIDGFQKPDAYIAAQGPLPETVKDFWQMVWDHKLRTIVMLTKPVEAGTVKCEVYWPEKVNETLTLKPTLQVRTTYMQYFADFDMRNFELSNPSEPSDIPLEVTHFFFTSWPDHGVPQFATALISFIKKVRKHYSSDGPPMVVHCSAGVGRSGTFITLDTMLQRMPHTDNVNVYEVVRNMRMKRVFMVQTLAQYIFIHDALEELITCGNTSFNVQDMITRMAALSDVVPGKEITGFEEQFNLLQNVSRQFVEGDCSDALSQHNTSKNRHSTAVPYNASRVQLKATPLPGSEYINASFVDGYKHRNAFIATQCPMENTVNDFWRMMWESQSAVIVMLCSEKHDPEEFYKYWPDEEALYGKVKVTMKSKTERSSYTGYRFTVMGESVKMTPLQVTLLHYTEWAPLKAPINTKALLAVTKELLEVQRHTGNKAITVMCSDGCGRTGSFITIYYTLERVKAEQTVDIFQAIKNSRIRRTGLVSNTEQYKHCHQAVTEFLDEFTAYANFV